MTNSELSHQIKESVFNYRINGHNLAEIISYLIDMLVSISGKKIVFKTCTIKPYSKFTFTQLKFLRNICLLKMKSELQINSFEVKKTQVSHNNMCKYNIEINYINGTTHLIEIIEKIKRKSPLLTKLAEYAIKIDTK